MIGFFDIWKPSLEKADVRQVTRGAIENKDVKVKTCTVLIKRRDAMSDFNEGEDRISTTTVHFKPEDADVAQVGNYIKVDGLWRKINAVRDGKDFSTGKTEFWLATLDGEIIDNPTDPDWSV